MKYLIIILILLTSCESQRAARKTNWLKNHGYLSDDSTKKDVTIPEQISTDSGDNISDSIQKVIERIIQLEYKDTCIPKKKVSEIASKAANSVNSKVYVHENNRHKAEYWIANGKPMLKIVDKKIDTSFNCPPQITHKEKVNNSNKFSWSAFWKGFAFGVILVMLFSAFIRKYT